MIESLSGNGLWEQLTELIHKNGWPVKEFTRERASLEDAFRFYVKAGASKSPQKEKAV